MNIYKSFFDNYSKFSWFSVFAATLINFEIKGPLVSAIETVAYLNLTTYLLLEKELIKKTPAYIEVKKKYKTYLIKFSLLIKELNLTNPEEIYALCLYMMEHNYLYLENTLGTKVRDLPKLEGADVLASNGVCKNISKLLTDIFTSAGYDAMTLAVKADISSGNKLIELFGMFMPNHAVTIVKGCKVHLFDLTNNLVLNKINISYSHSLFNGFINGCDVKRIKEMTSDVENITIPNKKIVNNKELINIFYIENKYLCDQITDELNKVKTINKRVLF